MGNVDKLEVADGYFALALECFLDRKDYASAIHLAGAAQEFYGKWIRINGGKNFQSQILDISEEMYKNNGRDFNRKQTDKLDRVPKNTLKHMDNEEDRFVWINLEMEALILLGETMADHYMAGRSKTALIDRFNQHFKNLMKNENDQ